VGKVAEVTNSFFSLRIDISIFSLVFVVSPLDEVIRDLDEITRRDFFAFKIFDLE
jgi:hypothetical protein